MTREEILKLASETIKYLCYESPSGELHWFREDRVQLMDLNSDWTRVRKWDKG